MRLVLASGNPCKAEEIRPLLAGAGVELVAAGEIVTGWAVEETGTTLVENARLKARAAVDATGDPAIADDTGLFVDALGGAPGIHAARYSGPGASYEDNVRKLLAAMEGVPQAERGARFRTVALIMAADGREAAFEGELAGRIPARPRGGHGFGYDPVFLVPEEGCTLAEMELEVKNRISHRAKAIRQAGSFLAQSPEWLAPGGPRLAREGSRD